MGLRMCVPARSPATKTGSVQQRLVCQTWGCHQPRPEPSMTQYKRIGIDTSKSVFTIHCIDASGSASPTVPIFVDGNCWRSSGSSPSTEIAIESCGSAYHWARELTALGHEVRLVPPQYVKPYVKRGKTTATTPRRSVRPPAVRACISCR